MTQVNLEDVPRYNSATGNLEVNGVPIVVSVPAGADGDFIYVAYASADDGTGFTQTFNASLDYVAIKRSATEIVAPVVGDFVGLWKGWKGATGATGNTVLSGTAAPTTEGVDDNFYIRTTTNFLYGPKAAGVWPAGVSMTGTLPSNAVVVDPVTGQFETVAGAPIAEGFVDTVVDLITLIGSAYDNHKLIVKNPGDNLSNYFPAELFRMNSEWHTLGGISTLYIETPRQRITWPAETWDDGNFSITTSGGGAHTLITSLTSAKVGLTSAVQLPASTPASYVYVIGSTGAGSEDWPIGLVQIVSMDAAVYPGGDYLVLDYPWTPQLRQPVFACGGVTSPIVIRRISIPPLSSIGGFESLLEGKNTKNSNQHKYTVRYGASGVAIGSAVLVADSSTSTLDAVVRNRGGINNAGSTSVNITTGPIDDIDGWGFGGSGTTYGAYAIPNGAANTDLLVCMETSNGADIVMELVSIQVNWWR